MKAPLAKETAERQALRGQPSARSENLRQCAITDAGCQALPLTIISRAKSTGGTSEDATAEG
jgi:hypothetical protein